MTSLQVDHLFIRYRNTEAVHDLSFSLQSGEIGCLLGPSGCGKTTTLRSIAGFIEPHSGNVLLDNISVSRPGWMLPTEQRRIGMVFQDFALFPHLNIADNIGFGLHTLTKNMRQQRINELLELVGLPHLLLKYPHELSGGQQQRIALARAIAPRPHILLLDEPFSSIDIELREQLAREVRNIIKQESITALLVTHDQLEAFAVADHIGVMRAGRLHQWDTGYNLYHEPNDLFVADFIGQGTLVPGTVLENKRVETEFGIFGYSKTRESLTAGDTVHILVRPDDVIHDDLTPKIMAVVTEKAFRGADFLYTLRLPTGQALMCLAPSHHNHAIGEAIGIRLELDHLVLFKGEPHCSVS
ncbi:MAG: ABC transporter ATP-binding protein [Gammaproteobacteria bacterium]|nr:ABC transporter ATP-binding protein [Gammaproteobacteria bacterium]